MLRSVLEQMLEAANWAPTHGRTEPWRFVVLGADALQDMISLTDRVSINVVMCAKVWCEVQQLKQCAHSRSLTFKVRSQHGAKQCYALIVGTCEGHSALRRM